MTRPIHSSTFHFLLLAGLMLVFACSPDLPEDVAKAYDELPSELTFNIHVKPILSDKCFACHGPDQGKREADLRLDVAEAAKAELHESPGKRAIIEGKPEQSELFHRILATNPEDAMPPPEFKVELSAHEKAVLIKWIEEGATYTPHWAFIQPKKPDIPTLRSKETLSNPIDNFVRQQLQQRQLEASPEADKETLLRRVSFDLTGLPPTIEEIQAFLNDGSEDAYEKQVDRLLFSPHYGEKLATDWMDLARYSDTYGYQVDRYRDMSPWRDWVIQSFNDNMPYDSFLIWQLAGDLLPSANQQQILATGFNRLHPQNMEDGIVDEEYRVENVADRVAVLGDGLMGLTLSCAKCHDHKYDPISQKEYYELFSFFNNINETGQISWDQGTPVPTLMLPTDHQTKLLSKLQDEIAQREDHLSTITKKEQQAIERWIDQKAFQKIPKRPGKGLQAYYPLERFPFVNQVHPKQIARMEREFSVEEVPQFTKGVNGKSVQTDGDAWIELEGVGIFNRDEAFSIGLWVYIPKELEEGVIFHKNKGTQLHAYRGYHLYLKENKLEWLMARTWPENAIIEHTLDDIPKDQWLQLTVCYDGSSTAAGTRIFVNGEEAETVIQKDNLSKDILFHDLVDIIYPKPIEPNLQIAGRWRGRGLTNAKVDEILVYDRVLSLLEIQQLAGKNIRTQFAQKEPSDLTHEDRQQLGEYYLSTQSNPYTKALAQLAEARSAWVDSMEQVQEVMVMEEMEEARKTYVLNRGVYDDYGEEVFPNTPASLPSIPEEFPRNRLGLAQWLTLSNHPLTARVAVNRYWQLYFGRGLVKTSQDFGNQGELPSHPELLDWLAITFVESGWDVKALQKLIVTSATYKQSSLATAELIAIDKENKWLARGPSLRLTSEMIRDNALAASGLLNSEIGGESVYPYQPEGLWSMNFDPYIQDQGDKLYRRSFYTLWRRTIPNPTLATFDQPERNLCTVKRQKTNTPLQALVLLNDPTFVEAAKAMGEQMAGEDTPIESIRSAYTKLTGTSPQQRELQLLTELQEKEYHIFKTHPDKAKGWLEAGAHIVDDRLDPNLVASYAVVASVIMNGDATITKR